MNTVVVTVRYNENEIDLALPSSVPLFMLAPILVKKLDWPGLVLDDPEIELGARSKNTGSLVRPTETLKQAQIVDGDILELLIIESREQVPDFPQAGGVGTYLQCITTGQVFPVVGRANLIGRAAHVTINLSSLPSSDAVSRTHANLIRRGLSYWIKDERSANGTIVDGFEVSSGENARLRDGTQIQFGADGPTLVFHTQS